MGRQHRRTTRGSVGSLLALGGGLLLAGACSGGEGGKAASAGARGIHFPDPVTLLGRMYSGEERSLEYAFTVRGDPVVVSGLRASCGCTEERILVGGEPLPLPAELAPGTEGRVRVLYSSAGFKGEKAATVTVLGEGPGLPAELGLRSFLVPWFETEPASLDLGPIDPAEPQVTQLTVRGPRPFLLQRPERPFPFGITVAGLPTPRAAREHALEVRLPAREPDQPLPDSRQLAVLRIPADNGYELAWSLAFEPAAALYVKPYALLLGRLRRGVRSEHAVEVGVREGGLEILSWETEGFDGLDIQSVTLEEDRRYSFQVIVPADLELDGPTLYTNLKLDLRHTVGGRSERLQREVKITAVLIDQAPTGS